MPVGPDAQSLASVSDWGGKKLQLKGEVTGKSEELKSSISMSGFDLVNISIFVVHISSSWARILAKLSQVLQLMVIFRRSPSHTRGHLSNVAPLCVSQGTDCTSVSPRELIDGSEYKPTYTSSCGLHVAWGMKSRGTTLPPPPPRLLAAAFSAL